jgi:phosphoglycerate dehydrogenase-like enzyme
MKIFACLSLTPTQLARLRASLPHDELIYRPDEEKDAQSLAGCEVAFGNPPPSWLTEARDLRWIQLESVGFGEYGALDWATLGKRLKISKLAGFFAEPVAQSILAGILSLYRGIGQLAVLQEKRQWVGGALRPSLKTLQRANVVLFGAGAINNRVAELLRPYDCQMARFGRSWTKDALDTALRRADLTIAVVPHTPGTTDVFDRRRLALLKPLSMFVNFGRGSLLDEDALADALESGALGGAVIDVTRDEPLPPEHRFWRTRNLLLTQHTGGGTGDEADRKIDVFLANLERYKRDMAPLSIVDFKRGY